MTLRDPSYSVTWLGVELREHQAGITIDFLADHGWQVGLSSPGGSLTVHALEGDQKWQTDGGPSLPATIGRAIEQASAEGWW